MATDRLTTADVALFSSDFAGIRRLRSFGYWTASVFSLAAYVAALAWILSSSTATVYGFPVSHDLPTLIEITLQIGPMLAALFMVLLLPVKERIVGAAARRTAMTLAVSAAAAVIATCATTLAVLTVCEFRPGVLRPLTILWVAAEFAYDLTLIGIFTTALYAVKRKLWVTMALFILYIVAVVTAGPAWGITSYIGFGSTVPVMLTTYATAPLYDGAAWLLRAYWTGIAALMVWALYAFDRRRETRPRAAWPVTLALCAICIATAAGLMKLQAHGIARYQAPAPAALAAALHGDREAARLRLQHFDIRLDYGHANSEVALQGTLEFRNGTLPAPAAYFQLPAAIAPEQLEIQGGGDYRLVPLGKYLQVKFSTPLPPSQELRVQYRGAVRPAGAFDLSVQSKVLSGAFFLADADLLLAARSPACLASPPAAACEAAENYLMADRATGRIAVNAPALHRVLSPGEESYRLLGGGMAEHVFTISAPRLATFLVACAPFRESVARTPGGVKVRVLRSATAARDGEVEAPLAARILAFYESSWPAYPRRELTIVETPTPLGEAMAFDGEVALSDKIIASRTPLDGAASNLLEFVMAHEIAHQWWGFNVVPARSPGRLFVLESIPQFAAYKFLAHRGILNEQTARRNEERRYLAARARLGNREVPLVRSEIADEIAYNKGPFALLSMDQSGGSAFQQMGRLIAEYSYQSHGATAPGQVAAALLAEIPEADRETARNLLYGAAK